MQVVTCMGDTFNAHRLVNLHNLIAKITGHFRNCCCGMLRTELI